MNNEYKILGRVGSPEDIKKLSYEEIDTLCGEIRQHIVDVTTENGGHLASNLGVVELTVAAHRVFNAPKDHIIFDVGHQSYTHKLLTGRFEEFSTLRQAGGLTGFTNRFESEYDCFGAGHSSTSLSAGLGFAESDRINGSDAYTVVILGDGAFTGGMIHEALNNCDKNLKLVIILNENEMSISKNIGRFASSIAKLRRKKGYFKAKKFTVSFIKKIPLLGNVMFKGIRKLKKSLKNTLYRSNYFEDMGLYYLGPADGNNYRDVEALLEAAKGAGESVLVHLKTKKGYGYTPAEENPSDYHGLRPQSVGEREETFSGEIGKALCQLAEDDKSICAITAAMATGTGLDSFAKSYPERFFDVGIAEEHAVTFAAGLAANGMKPIFAVYSSFLQRSYDQMIHDVALQKLPIVICVDRAGFNNSDGATHHGLFDVAFTSQINGFDIYSPMTFDTLRLALKEAVNGKSPAIIRYPSGCENEQIKKAFFDGKEKRGLGIKCDVLPESMPKTVIITHGRIVAEALRAKNILMNEGRDVAIILCEHIAPYDILAEEINDFWKDRSPENIVFLEEEIKVGGFGMLLSQKMRENGMLDGKKHMILAAEDAFVTRKAGESYLEASGLDADSIVEKIKNFN